MLVLSRRCDEAVVMGDADVTIKVLDIEAGVVRLGIAAPPEISIHRQEVYSKIKADLKRNSFSIRGKVTGTDGGNVPLCGK